MTKRYMLDTVANPANGNVPTLPTSVKLGGKVLPISLQAGYVNGSFAWKSRHPNVWIDVNGTDPAAHVLDCETGDATPGQTPGWAKAHNAAKTEFPAVIYVNRSNLTPVFNAMAGAGLHVARDFYLWIATLDGTESVADMTGVVAVQAYGAAALGFNADLSVVYDDVFPRAAPSTGPFRHVVAAGNTQSLQALAVSRATTEDAIIDRSLPLLSPEHAAVINAYMALEAACVAAGTPRPAMPEGLVYYTSSP